MVGMEMLNWAIKILQRSSTVLAGLTLILTTISAVLFVVVIIIRPQRFPIIKVKTGVVYKSKQNPSKETPEELAYRGHAYAGHTFEQRCFQGCVFFLILALLTYGLMQGVQRY